MISVATGIVSYLSTTVFGGIALFALVIAVSIPYFSRNIERSDIILLTICLSSVIISMFLFGFGYRIEGASAWWRLLVSFPIFLFIGAMTRKVVDENFLNAFLACLFLELLVAFWEHHSGVRTFFSTTSQPEMMDLPNSDYLYYNRTFGFSNNSSQLAAKMLFGLVVISFLKYKYRLSKLHYLLYAMIIAGFYINFSRAALVASFLSVLVFVYLHGKRYVALLVASGIAVAPLVLFYVWDTVFEQLNRGRSQFDWSGRDEIWNFFIEYIDAHLLFGNLGQKVYFVSDGMANHSHNSYIQILSTSGLVFTVAIIIYMAYYSIKNGTFLILVPLLAYSVFQYGVFWGASLYDQIFWAFALWGAGHALSRQSLPAQRSVSYAH